MKIIELATKRLEDMTRAGVKVPWTAAGLEQSEIQSRVNQVGAQPNVESNGRHSLEDVAPSGSSMRQLEAPSSAVMAAVPMPPVPHADAEPSVTVKLNLKGLESAGHLVSTQTRSNLSEEFSHIKRQLLRNARGEQAAENRLSLILVTSALPGDGKTFCTANLAISMAAEVDTSVLLVDADVVRPALLNRLGIRAQRGLLDVLTDPSLDLRDVVLKTNVPKLSILPPGLPNRISTELLASDAMEALLSSLPRRYPGSIVILDGPPLLVTNEAKVLASRVGQVVLIVKAATTPRRAVGQALAALEQCPVVMTVLNQARDEVPHGYGYGYGYHLD